MSRLSHSWSNRPRPAEPPAEATRLFQLESRPGLDFVLSSEEADDWGCRRWRVARVVMGAPSAVSLEFRFAGIGYGNCNPIVRVYRKMMACSCVGKNDLGHPCPHLAGLRSLGIVGARPIGGGR